MKKVYLGQFSLVVLVFFSLISFGQGTESSSTTESLPTCPYPQVLSGALPGGLSWVTGQVAILWNGNEFIMFGRESTTIVAQKVFADGTLDGYATTIAVSNGGGDVVACSTSYGYEVAYCHYDYSSSKVVIMAVALNPSLSVIKSPVQVSFYGTTPTANCSNPSIACNQSYGSCIVWEDSRNGNSDIYATRLNASGDVSSADIQITTNTSNQQTPNCIYNQNIFLFVWTDYRSTTSSIYGRTMYANDNSLNPEKSFVSTSGNCTKPVLASAANRYAIAWVDDKDGNTEIYIQLFNSNQSPVIAPVRVTNDSHDSADPRLLWTGAEFDLFWRDSQPLSLFDFWFQAFDEDLVPKSSNILKITFGQDPARRADVQFASKGFLISYTPGGIAGPNAYTVLGCNYSGSTPTCPQNTLAYSITGTQATISWLPSSDSNLDLAYYRVFRNNTLVAKTINNYYTDTGLSTNTTYNYAVRAVNAAGNESSYCDSTSSVYVKTNASLTLMVNKSDPNAHLFWTDAGLNNYNIYRGTSPQVLSLVGSTSGQSADDPNVLMDSNNYFYTVDDPCQ